MATNLASAALYGVMTAGAQAMPTAPTIATAPLLSTTAGLFTTAAKRMQSVSDCYLSAIIEGEAVRFATAKDKFTALADSWNEYNLGRSVIDYHDFAMQQIIGMGAVAVPFLIQKVAEGESEWVYALKSITGQEADTADMLGEEERIIEAWVHWGERNAESRR